MEIANLFGKVKYMNIMPFIPKDDDRLPDNYGIKIIYVNGKVEEFELASHFINKEINLLEFWTKDDFCHWVPISSIQRIELDKRFSKIIAIREKAKGKVGEN